MTDVEHIAGKTCVVVGAGGFLGAQLCPRLVALGAKVRAYGRTRYYEAPLKGVHWFTGTLEDVQKLATLLEGVDVVFHLAATSSPASAEASRVSDLNTNVGGSLGLLDLCRHAGIERIVFASSGGTVYGDANNPPFSESTLPKPISAYGINKLAAEHYHRLYNHHYGMRNISLRIANPFGPYQHGLKSQGIVSVFTRQVLEGSTIRVWGDGSVQRDYLYGADVAEAMIKAAIYDGGADTFNIGSGVGRSINDVIGALEIVLGQKIPVEFQKSRRIDVATSILDCSLAKRELGWHAGSDWMTSLEETCNWIRQDIRAANT
ncbi:MAG: NAD-dependent epimerase/dehydratase family protein [Hyphomicrobiaceae bacterium]|nr:NAD-dependent epimerase/dehydratase family protein [Hyphomicrobiaceae bacterium]